MIELELVMKEVERLYAKEKSLRKRIMLENALKSLHDYEKESQ